MAMPTQLTQREYDRIKRRASVVQVTETEKPAQAPRRKRRGVPDAWKMTEREQEVSRAFMSAARAQGWQADTIKYPCSHQDASYWHGKPFNAVVIWRGREQRMWCLCEIVEMGAREMREVIEDVDISP